MHKCVFSWFSHSICMDVSYLGFLTHSICMGASFLGFYTHSICMQIFFSLDIFFFFLPLTFCG